MKFSQKFAQHLRDPISSQNVHVRHRGGEQQQQQIVAYADACEFVRACGVGCERTSTANHIVVVLQTPPGNHPDFLHRAALGPGSTQWLPVSRVDPTEFEVSTASGVHVAVEVCAEHRSGTRNGVPRPRVLH